MNQRSRVCIILSPISIRFLSAVFTFSLVCVRIHIYFVVVSIPNCNLFDNVQTPIKRLDIYIYIIYLMFILPAFLPIVPHENTQYIIIETTLIFQTLVSRQSLLSKYT